MTREEIKQQYVSQVPHVKKVWAMEGNEGVFWLAPVPGSIEIDLSGDPLEEIKPTKSKKDKSNGI